MAGGAGDVRDSKVTRSSGTSQNHPTRWAADRSHKERYRSISSDRTKRLPRPRHQGKVFLRFRRIQSTHDCIQFPISLKNFNGLIRQETNPKLSCSCVSILNLHSKSIRGFCFPLPARKHPGPINTYGLQKLSFYRSGCQRYFGFVKTTSR